MISPIILHFIARGHSHGEGKARAEHVGRHFELRDLERRYTFLIQNYLGHKKARIGPRGCLVVHYDRVIIFELVVPSEVLFRSLEIVDVSLSHEKEVVSCSVTAE